MTRPDAETRALPVVAVLLALGGAVSFSGKAIIVKLAYRYAVDPATLIMLRMTCALPLFAAMAWWAGRGLPNLSGRDRRAVAALGFCGYYLASYLDFVGLQYISAGLERLILYLTPGAVLLIGWLWHRRRASVRQLATLALGYGGIALVFGHEAKADGQRVALGAALVLASTISYAIYLIGSGEVVRRIGALRLAGWATTVACALCIGQWLLVRPVQSLASVPEPVLWLSLLNGAACTAAPVLMTMMAIERIGAALTAQMGMVGPISTIVLGVLVLDEPFTASMAAGSACVLAAVWLLARVR